MESKQTLKLRTTTAARREVAGGWRKQTKGIKRDRPPVIKQISHSDEKQSMENIVTNIVIMSSWGYIYRGEHRVMHKLVETLCGAPETNITLCVHSTSIININIHKNNNKAYISSKIFGQVTRCYNDHYGSIREHRRSPSEKPSVPWKAFLTLPLQLPATTELLPPEICLFPHINGIIQYVGFLCEWIPL